MWLEMFVKGIGLGILSLLVTAVIAAIAAIPVYYLWNWLMPAIFGVVKISLPQAIGISCLTGFLFKSSGSSKSSSSKK